MDESGILGIFAGAGVLSIVISLAVAVFFVICNWKIFEKAGYDGWKSLIPFYNTYIMFEMAWGKGWMMFCTFIPLIGFVFPVICLFKLAKAFGKEWYFGLGLMFLSVICYPMLAFGNARYIGPAE